MSLPKKTDQRIQYVEQHITPFTTNATAIGLVSADVTDLDAKATAARAAFDLRESLWQQAEAATLDLNSKVESMSVAWASCSDKIKGKAKQVGGTTVYTLAQIPAPATPTSVGAPGAPFEMKVTLKPNGSLKLGWKCANPAGCTNVIYQVYRKVTGDAEFEYIGGAGQREFTDVTVPSGVATVTYSIQGTRSTAVGDAQEFVVNFGTTGSTTVTATITGATPKIAA